VHADQTYCASVTTVEKVVGEIIGEVEGNRESAIKRFEEVPFRFVIKIANKRSKKANL